LGLVIISLSWLVKGNLSVESEAFLYAAQEPALSTRYTVNHAVCVVSIRKLLNILCLVAHSWLVSNISQDMTM